MKDKIEEENAKYTESIKEFESIQNILNHKQEEIKLKDVIENEGRKKVKELFSEEVGNLNELRFSRAALLDKLERKLKDLEDPKRKDRILTNFRINMKKFTDELDLDLEHKNYQDISKIGRTTGSRRPRALIAYYLSILNVMKTNSSSVFAPIIIDSQINRLRIKQT